MSFFRCPYCDFSIFAGKTRCPKYCDEGYLRAAVGEHTSIVPIDDFEINDSDKNNVFVTIKRSIIHNSGKRKGTYAQNIIVKSLGEEIGRYDGKVELKPTEKEEIKDIKIQLPKFLWLRNEMLEREPSRSDFEVEVSYKVLDVGDKCDACDKGFNKCSHCWKGYRFRGR